jgi:acyl-coenzyme A thioesterase PaaI-like protein
MQPAGAPLNVPDQDGMARRRAAIVELGTAVRGLIQAVIDTEVEVAVLDRAAGLARDATGLLQAATRPANRLSALDRAGPDRRIYSPVVGMGNPVAPPLTPVHIDAERLRVEEACTLHRVHEGPPTFGHGGMSAMLLDQVLGHAVALTGRVGLTRTLTVGYRRPVPIGVPLLLTAQVTDRDETRVVSQGRITTQAEPDVPLVTAEGTFLVPTPDQVQRLFGHLEPNSEGVPTGD